MAGLDPESCPDPFTDRAALTARGTAETMPERSGDLTALERVLAPSREQRRPVGVLLYGPSGSGKTELALQSADGFRRVGGTVVHLECVAEDTLFRCCRRLANDLGGNLPESGLALETAIERTTNRLETVPGPRCVVLDDVDRLDADVRRELLQSVVDAVADDAAIATIATSTPLTLRNELAAFERSLLGDSERALAAYDTGELRSIFDRRVGLAFRDGAIEDDVVEGAVEMARERDGDAGFGLELLAAAGDAAQVDCETRVTGEHLVHAREQVAVDEIATLIDELRPHQRLTLRALCELTDAGETPARVGTVFDAYESLCAAVAEEPNTKRSLQNYLGRLVDVGLVEAEEVRTETGGRFNRYDLTRSADLVTAALGPTD